MSLFMALRDLWYTGALAIVILASKVNSIYCDGGRRCSPPKECCTVGCCILPANGVSNTTSLLNFVLWNHWFFWCLLLLLVLSCIGGCGLWRRRPLFAINWCCRSRRNEDERSEPDSVGSCYPPPHYSRCSSFHHAPPPYTEVTSKPDLYPLVISYNSENGKTNGNYLMVQYFRNFLVRPTLSSISAGSTADSISSSFLCQSAADDCCVPPSYEEQRRPDASTQAIELQTIIRSTSSQCSNRSLPQVRTTQDGNYRRASCTFIPNTIITNEERNEALAQPAVVTTPNTSSQSLTRSISTGPGPPRLQTFRTPVFRNNYYSTPTFRRPPLLTTFQAFSTSVEAISVPQTHQYTSDVILAQPQQYYDTSDLHYYSTDIINRATRLVNFNGSFSSDDNLSPTRGSIQDFVSSDGLSQPSNLEMHHYSTGSDISSLQGCGTPDSPPQATSPTGEFRDILDKIQQLPLESRSNSFSEDVLENEEVDESVEECSLLLEPDSKPAPPKRPNKLSFKRGFPVRSKTFYMPVSQASKRQPKSHSAPVTPISNFPSPSSFALHFFASGRKLGSKRSLENVEDGSPLLTEEAGDSGDEVF